MLRRESASVVSINIVLFSVLTLNILLPQDRTNAVNVSGHHGQGHIAFESLDAMIGAYVQTMHFQAIDG